MYPYLTDEDIQFIEDDARQYVQDFIKKYEPKKKLPFKYKSKPVFATAVIKSSIQSEKEKACLEWLRQKMRDANPILRKKFMDKVEGVEF